MKGSAPIAMSDREKARLTELEERRAYLIGMADPDSIVMVPIKDMLAILDELIRLIRKERYR